MYGVNWGQEGIRRNRCEAVANLSDVGRGSWPRGLVIKHIRPKGGIKDPRNIGTKEDFEKQAGPARREPLVPGSRSAAYGCYNGKANVRPGLQFSHQEAREESSQQLLCEQPRDS